MVEVKNKAAIAKVIAESLKESEKPLLKEADANGDSFQKVITALEAAKTAYNEVTSQLTMHIPNDYHTLFGQDLEAIAHNARKGIAAIEDLASLMHKQLGK